jgi:GntR family carbon starvation induced transcriptional regulator
MVELAAPDAVDVPRSQTSLAYVRLKADILAGRLAPDQRLKINDLAGALEVSPGAVREALSRMVAEQLVVSRDQKGFVVAPLSIDDLNELTDLRCEIEAVALRWAVAAGDEEWEARILAASHRLRRTAMSAVDASLAAAWVDRHAAFHRALVSGCGNRRLLELHTRLYQQAERYRGISAYSHVARNVEGEHDALVDAAMDRDAEKLVALAIEHVRRTRDLIVAAVRERVEPQVAAGRGR